MKRILTIVFLAGLALSLAAKADETRAINSAEDIALLAKLKAEADAKRSATPAAPSRSSCMHPDCRIETDMMLMRDLNDSDRARYLLDR